MTDATCAVGDCEKKAVTRDLCHGHYARWRKKGVVGGPLREIIPKGTQGTVCAVADCGRLPRARHLCEAHNRRWKKYGDVQAWRPLKVSGHNPPECTVEGCGREATAHRLCQTHRKRLREKGILGGPVRVTFSRAGASGIRGTCEVLDCERPIAARNFCSAHYQRLRLTGDVRADVPIKKYGDPGGRRCCVEGCDRSAPQGANRMCARCSQRAERGAEVPGSDHGGRCMRPNFCRRCGDVPSPCEGPGCENLASPGGRASLCRTHQAQLRRWGELRPIHVPAGRWVSPAGYINLLVPGRARGIGEHRIIMESLLGRALLPGENVHHLNRIRSDNSTDGPLRLVDGRWRSGNLELWTYGQPCGARVEDLVSNAKALLALYEPKALALPSTTSSA